MKIEVWSDIVCPWCYNGKRYLEEALATAKLDDVEIVYRSFELDMGMAQQVDLPLDVILSRKYGTTLERAQEMIANITGVAETVGVEFHLDKTQTGNTYNAHRLIHLARESGLDAQLKERLLAAYFTEGKSVSDIDSLVALAESVGVDATRAREVLMGTEYGQDVRDEEALAVEMGVRGVPFFVINGEFGLSGAQRPEAFLEAFEMTNPSVDAHSCGVEGC